MYCRRRGRGGVSAAVSIAVLVPVLTLASVLLLSVYVQATMSQQAGLNQAGLAAEEGKKYLRVTALRGPSNQTLINLYGAGKLPITVDYLLVELQNGTILAERGGNILSVGPGENVTVAPSQLDPRLAPYDGDYWKAKREIRQLILHTSDGNSLYLSWGAWAGATAATYSTNTATTTTQTSSTTTTIVQTGTVLYRVLAASTTVTTSYIGGPRSFTSVSGWQAPYAVSFSCDVWGRYYYSSIQGTYVWTIVEIDCTVTASGAVPPYAVYLRWWAQSLSPRGSLGPYTISSSGGSVRITDGTGYLYGGVNVVVEVDVVESSVGATYIIRTSCWLYPVPTSPVGTATCTM
ncbi:MAG: hypothetical protein QXD32_05630 [Nitrososphaerota archaeon]